MTTTGPTRLCEVHDDRVQERAEELVRATAEETVRETFYFVRDTIEYSIRRKMRGAAETLERGKGMCFDKTGLFIALCRANGVPARYREMHCTLDADGSLPADAFHMVSEVRLDGDWSCQDPSFDPGLEDIVTVSEWDRQTWTSVQRERRYDTVPFYLPPIVNHVLVPLSPRLRKIQSAIDAARDGSDR